MIGIALLLLRSAIWVGSTTVGVALNMGGALALLLLITPESVWGYTAAMFGVAVVGCIGGAVIGAGQVLALRRWLDGAASLASVLSAMLASSAALAMSVASGWWVHTMVGDVAGTLVALVVYGSLFGFLQRPMVDYMARSSSQSLLWVPVNVAAAVLGGMAMLAAFYVSGGRREMLQFRYAGLAYGVVTGLAFLLMTRQMRKAIDAQRRERNVPDAPHVPNVPNVPYPPTWPLPTSPLPDAPRGGVDYAGDDAGVLEIHEHRILRIYRVNKVNREPGGPADPRTRSDDDLGNSGNPGNLCTPDDRRNTGSRLKQARPHCGNAPDVIDAPYRILP